MKDIQSELGKIKTFAKEMSEKTKDLYIPKPYKGDKTNCPVCGDLKVLRQDLPVGHPEFGKLIPCDCSKYVMYSQVSGLTQYECHNLSWSGIKKIGNIKKAEMAVKRVMKLGYGWVYFYGYPGVGKTHLLKTATAEFIREGRMTSYTNMSAIIDDMREAYDTDSPSRESERRLQKWSDIDILMIDEFDRVRSTEYAEERKFRLMDTRYQLALMQRSITILASNEPPTIFSDYLRDRIEDGRFEIMQVEGGSVRPQMDWEGRDYAG